MLLPGGFPVSIGVAVSREQLVQTPWSKKNLGGALSPRPQYRPLVATYWSTWMYLSSYTNFQFWEVRYTSSGLPGSVIVQLKGSECTINPQSWSLFYDLGRTEAEVDSGTSKRSVSASVTLIQNTLFLESILVVLYIVTLKSSLVGSAAGIQWGDVFEFCQLGSLALGVLSLA